MLHNNFKKVSGIIISKLENSHTRVFNKKTLKNFLSSNRKSWGESSKRISQDEVIVELVDNEILVRKKLTLKGSKESYIRYLYNSPSPFEVALSLQKDSYLTHSSAVFIHGLNDQIPKTIYVNKEQSKKPPQKKSISPKNTLTQDSINKAFLKPQRRSSSSISFDGYEIVQLGGKNTKRLHVQKASYQGLTVETTSLERTLIDIAVRPDYSGGTSQVLETYKNSKDKISINTLQALLKKLDYIYPYHQVICFYLEQSGFPEDKLNIFKEKFTTKFDFFLEYQMPESSKEYSKKWKLYYPKGL